MDYDNFEIRLTELAGGYAIRVEGPEGEDEVRLEGKVPSENLGEVVNRFRGAAGPGDSGQWITIPHSYGSVSALPALEDLASVGRELFSLLFPSEVAILWHRCRARAAEGGRGLRLRIHVDLRREAVAWFGTLPWELLYDDDSGSFLALDGRTPVVRYLDIRRPRRAVLVARPLRVLVVMPEPYGAPRLDLAKERENLLDAWREDERVELVFPDAATFDGVREAMAPGPIHAIHFMGHGIFDEKTGSGGLVLEGPTGRETPILGADVGKLVTGVEPPPALAILNGCETGCTGAEGSRWPFAGATTALMEAGVGACVAMQLPIGDDEAINFSRILYRALQRGQPVDRAVSEARLSLSELFRDPVWAIPALFMRVPDGRLFEEETRSKSGARVLGPELPNPSGDVTSVVRIGRMSRSRVKNVGRDEHLAGYLRQSPTRVETIVGEAEDSTIDQAAVRTRSRR